LLEPSIDYRVRDLPPSVLSLNVSGLSEMNSLQVFDDLAKLYYQPERPVWEEWHFISLVCGRTPRPCASCRSFPGPFSSFPPPHFFKISLEWTKKSSSSTSPCFKKYFPRSLFLLFSFSRFSTHLPCPSTNSTAPPNAAPFSDSAVSLLQESFPPFSLHVWNHNEARYVVIGRISYCRAIKPPPPFPT